MKYIKKYKFIIIIIVITLIRFLMSYNLPSLYFINLTYDDMLMINQTNSLLTGNYLGNYASLTLVKGIFYPLFFMIIRFFNFNYSGVLTIFYIISCIFFVNSLKYFIKSKKVLLLVYIVLLFNPISYSSEIFQR